MRDENDLTQDPWFPIAERIKGERKRAGLTRQQLANRVGVSRGTIFNWESGKRLPIEKCALLAAGLEIPADDILSIHPEVPKLGGPRPMIQDEPASVRFTRREVTLFGGCWRGLADRYGISHMVYGQRFVHRDRRRQRHRRAAVQGRLRGGRWACAAGMCH